MLMQSNNVIDFSQTTILSADICGYCRLMCEDEHTTHRITRSFFQLTGVLVHNYEGSVFQLVGDNLMATFVSPDHALHCANRMHELYDNDLSLRIGIHAGVINSDGQTLYGTTINVAARLQDLAPAGGTCISSSVYDAVSGRDTLKFQFAGQKWLKNISHKVKIYLAQPMVSDGYSTTARALEHQIGKRRKDSRTINFSFGRLFEQPDDDHDVLLCNS